MDKIKKARGKKGELIAKVFLEKCGYIIITQNYFSRWGEIDLIAQHTNQSIIVFVEVKSFKQNSFLHPLEAITLKKQENIRRTAELYIQESNLENYEFRFDVISILNDKVDQHIEHAFIWIYVKKKSNLMKAYEVFQKLLILIV